MNHIFLSPHMDDAVLSCGGLIAQLVQAGDSVTVFTLMAGAVPPDAPMTPFINEHFVRWAMVPDPVLGRHAEDRQSVTSLGGTLQLGDIPDALYRTNGLGVPFYPDLDRLFGAIHPHDPAVTRAAALIAALDPAATIYAPLGAGHHVDHQVVRKAVVDWLKLQSQITTQRAAQVAVFFYEEYPYSADDTTQIVQTARDAFGHATHPVLHYLSEAALDAKINAIACYRSQISTFWDDIPAMAAATRRYAMQVGEGTYAERLWQYSRQK
ncbi:MAG: PIG-L family deacetylase [Anaerolineae bacterium]|nr:PIG-L family deacetylase [Anaerolineae bacterium]